MEHLLASKRASISYLRIFATIGVVWLHTCSTLAENRELFALTERQYKFFCAAYQMMNWAVPVFFMITGSLLLGKKTSYRECICKYVKRVLLALCIFGIPFAAMKLVMETKHVSAALVVDSVRAVLEGKGLAHLWYLYVLIGIYLVLPVFQMAVSNMQESDFKWLLGALFLLELVRPLIRDLTGLQIAFSIPFTYPLFYLLLGYYISRKEEFIKSRTALCGAAVITAIIIAANGLNLYPAGLTEYTSPLMAVLASCVFTLFKEMKHATYSERIWKLDRLCFGVYLVHPVFIQFTYRFLKITPVSFGAWYLAWIGFFACFTACAFAASWAMSKITVLKKYIL